MKVHRGSRSIASLILNFALDRGEFIKHKLEAIINFSVAVKSTA